MITLRRIALVLFFALPSVAAALWSCWPSLQALAATRRFELASVREQDWGDAQKGLEIRRQLQHHFLSHNVYIPLEDIVITQPAEGEPSELALLMQKACGRGRLYVWIPLKFRVPITGEKVFEWCWKPQASSNST